MAGSLRPVGRSREAIEQLEELAAFKHQGILIRGGVHGPVRQILGELRRQLGLTTPDRTLSGSL
jgi:hypothetical protein